MIHVPINPVPVNPLPITPLPVIPASPSPLSPAKTGGPSTSPVFPAASSPRCPPYSQPPPSSRPPAGLASGESTLRRWLEEPRFRTALDRLRQDAYEIALVQVQALVPECLNIFARIAVENTDPVLRMRAARYLLNYGMKYREVDELHRKLRALEQAVEADKSTKPQL